MKIKTKKKLRTIMVSLVAILLLLFGCFYLYTMDYYKADDTALKLQTNASARIESKEKFTIIYPDEEKDTKTGLIFYPGGKVEDISYLPLLYSLSENGITCVLVRMPFNLAVFGVNKADKVYNMLPDMKDWYIAGHSLGGAMASSYVGSLDKKNENKLKGLILLAAYPVNDSKIDTIAIYGSEDQVLDKTKLKDSTNSLEIVGGVHAYFGDYGEQKGDGTATITREDQQKQTIEAIIKFINTTMGD